MSTRRRRLGAAIYRKELRAVANGEDTGPNPIPKIDAVLGDLDDETAQAEDTEATA